MFYRIECGRRLSYVIMDLEDLTGIDYLDLWNGLPSPPYDTPYGEFWFTEFGWFTVGRPIVELLEEYGFAHRIRTTDILEVAYSDEFQVATPRR